MKKPLSPDSANLTIASLNKARSFGHDPVELINAAIEGGWTRCVFSDKHFRPAAPPPSDAPRLGPRRKGQTIVEHMTEMHEVIFGKEDAAPALLANEDGNGGRLFEGVFSVQH